MFAPAANLTMDTTIMIDTDRLLLRPWKDSDKDAFAQLNCSENVMEFFPSTLTREESDALADSIIEHITDTGWGLWAAEEKNSGNFIGFIGLSRYEGNTHFSPAIEVGWRLLDSYWGKGYAPEGARAALDYAFNQLDLDEVVSFTSSTNQKSRRVMEKIGMTYDPTDDYDHPKISDGHPLQRHVLYRIRDNI